MIQIRKSSQDAQEEAKERQRVRLWVVRRAPAAVQDEEPVSWQPEVSLVRGDPFITFAERGRGEGSQKRT